MDVFGVMLTLINDFLHNMAIDFTAWFQVSYIFRPRLTLLDPIYFFYGSALGLANTISIALAAVLIPFGLLLLKIKTAAEALLNFAIVAMFGPLYFAAFVGLRDMGDTLALGAMFYNPTQGIFVSVPSLTAVAANVLSLGGILFFGLILGLIFIIYELLIPFVGWLMLPAFALRPASQKLKGFSNWLITLTLVISVIARPAAILILDIAKLVSDSFQATQPSLAAFAITAGYVVAIIAEWQLLKGTHYVVSHTPGWLKSRVMGAVKTDPQGRQNVDANVTRDQHARTMQPMPVTIVNPPAPQPSLASSLSQQAVRTGGQALLTKAAASTNPIVAGGVAVHEGYKAVRSLVNSQ